jgi:hypothetical protein
MGLAYGRPRARLDHRQSEDSLLATSPLGDAIETFIRRGHAERFVEGVRGDDPELASTLRVEERELQAGGLT